MSQSDTVTKQVPGEVLRRENYKGRARAYDNHAAKALIKTLQRKRETELALAEIGMKPLQPLSRLARAIR
jgi:hypothetical protein